MTLDNGTILSIVSLLLTVSAIVFYAGRIPEKIERCKDEVKRVEEDIEKVHNLISVNTEKNVDGLRRETEKAISEMQLAHLESVKRVHSRLDTLTTHLIGQDGAPVFVSKTECRDKRADIAEQKTATQKLLCTMLERIEKKFERAMSDWSTALTNQQSMMNEIMLIKADMKTLRVEINENRKH